ncbi:MAG: dTDP-glucose 4,6-dehydratase [Verrucomicrobiae bacterium]|nr:dTDP-glucose 4,6-dehydratase [Verrucomicrobiae bacterium]NNJ86145.1 dTDP-glucose 4,6-dehydratase [Akkermansiaceae bacterium]
MKILVTGGAGFVGSALVRHLIHELDFQVVNVDKLTYAANEKALESVNDHPAYRFEKVDICDADAIKKVFQRHQPDAVIHAAAESHVDRSIDGPGAFIQTNIVGTYTLLQATLDYWRQLLDSQVPTRSGFRFLHTSTDEVYGELAAEGKFAETSPYHPNSPYSASKASADHLTRAWHRTYGLPTLQTNSSNNYGPWQHQEKLIPRIVSRALAGETLPVFGSGKQVRDWLHVDDNARAITQVLLHGRPGETYNIGANCEIKNLTLVNSICSILDDLIDNKPAGISNFSELICHVDDRPGHDFRYALDTHKIKTELSWSPQKDFNTALRETIQHLVSGQ